MRPGAIKGSLVALVVVSTLFAGCVNDQAEARCYAGQQVRIEPLTADGAPRQQREGEAIVLRLGEEVQVRASVQECTDAALYRWRLSQLPSPYRGFSPAVFETKGATATIRPPYVGEYQLEVTLLTEDDELVSRSLRQSPLPIDVYLVEQAALPDDGSAYRLEYTTFCCPSAHVFNITEASGGAVDREWTKTLLHGNLVIWRGKGNGSDVFQHYERSMGTDWLETLRLEVRPEGPVPAPGQVGKRYEIEVRIGPGYERIYGVGR